jgi:hypothetical protein
VLRERCEDALRGRMLTIPEIASSFDAAAS